MDIKNEVVLYIRVSTEEQAVNGDSLRTQRDELTKYANSNGLHIYKIYEDDGFSATNLKRPALQEMLSDIKQQKFSRILITKLDRLSRGVRNYYKILDTLDENNVYWQTIFEKYDSSTANGRLHINIMLSVAENESAQTSERIKSVFKTKLLNKEIVSGKIPIGLKKEGKKLAIDEDKKQIILDAFEIYKETTSAYTTFMKLDLKYPECEFNYPRVHALLKNSIYIGIKKTKHGDILDFCPAIIDFDTFNNTQKLIEKNARKPVGKNTEGYLFQGMLECAECGYTIGGKIYTKNPPSSRYYYICKRHHSTLKCSCNTNFNEVKLEEKLLSEFKTQLNKYLDDYNYAIQEIKKTDSSKQITTLEKKLSKLKDLYIKDLIRFEDYEKDFRIYNTELNDLKNKKIKIEVPICNIEYLKTFLDNDFELTYNKLERIDKRRLWTTAIRRIILDKDYGIKIIFN